MAWYLALLLFFLFSPLAPEVHSTSKLSKPIHATLKHIDAMGSFTKAELLRRAAQRSRNRLAALSSERSVSPTNNTGLQATVKAGNGEFLMNLGVGTPAVTFTAIVDSGSDLVWTQCQTCLGCPPSVYNPLKSYTIATTIPCNSSLCLSLVPPICKSGCNYNYTYDDGSYTFGRLGTEMFTFSDSISVEGITFGCSFFTQGDWVQSDGLVGLGQGPLSLITQLGSPNFSYCFTSFGDSTTSPLIIGDVVVKDGQSTPIIPNPSFPSSYYLPVQNYLSEIETGLVCLTITGSTDISIFGNYQQQNFQVLFDVNGAMLYFKEADCDQL